MDQFIEFIGNHPVLAGLWLLLVIAIFLQHRSRASKSVGPQQAVMMINRQGAVVLDVRDKKEFDAGHIVDSINIPQSKLGQRLTELNKHKEKPVVVVCKMGQQSGEACKTLQQAGFNQVVRLAGGVTEWKSQSLPLVQK
ncbi:MAG: rhodanese-like domain-containing protein [Gammaproteobacteria bacterium]|nr:rhodanese-like domain-containing protein [Pseudomonadales bacterium]MCP5347310.1 rhodanese-like domain-containing protein [Pseudomonadales bacterium]